MYQLASVLALLGLTVHASDLHFDGKMVMAGSGDGRWLWGGGVAASA